MSKAILVFLFCLLVALSICDKTGLTDIPSFLKIIPSTKRTEMEKIVLNVTLSQNQINEQLDEWGKTLGGPLANLYTSYKNAFFEAKKELKEKHDAVMANETDEEFKKVDSEIQNIAENLDMPIGEVRQEIFNIINNQTDEIKQKLKNNSPY
uniref:DUF148 domain-containing protein n=1 Tax=Parastrongyloides trichosuri TaxID=131310 RepID=A0A0N4ZVF3_PARTI